MYKIALLGVPAYGHLYPMLPIIRELVQRGHQVLVFNEASFEPLIRTTGADFAPYPPVLRLEDFAQAVSTGDMVRWLLLILSASGPLLSGVLDRLEKDKPDIIAFDGIAVWGEMAATRLRMKSVSISTAFAFEVLRGGEGGGEIARYALTILKLLPNFTAAWMKMAPHGARNLPWRFPVMPRQGTLTLMLTSKALHPETSLFDNPRFAFVGPSMDPQTRSDTFDFSRLSGRPLIYVSLGTLHFGNAAFFHECIEALAGGPIDMLISVGRGTDLRAFADAPANVIVAESVPQLEVLRRASIFISHAGLNSLHESLWYGVPMVAVPQQVEQLRNAKAMRRLGAGVILDDEAHGRRVTVAALRQAVATVEADLAGYTARAKAAGDTLRQAGGYLEAVRRIEGVLDGVSAHDDDRELQSQ